MTHGLHGCLALLLAQGLAAQAPPGDNQVAADGRSGTVVLHLDQDLRRTFGFSTAGYGLAPDKKGGVRHDNAQLVVAAQPEGDEFHVGWQPGESARVLDLGPQTAGISLFDRITVHDARHRLETRPRAGKRLLLQQDHVYLVAIDGPARSERFVLPGDPLFVKWMVVAHEPGKRATLRWAILNEPLGAVSLADGSFDVRLLPPLDCPAVTAKERLEIEGLLAKVIADEGVDDATTRLGALGPKMLPAAVNLLCSLDRSSQADSDAAWRLDAGLTKAISGRNVVVRNNGLTAKHLLDHHKTMVCWWYAFARLSRNDPDWQATVARFQRLGRKR